MIKYFDKPIIRKITGFPVFHPKEERTQRSFADLIIKSIPVLRILAVLWFLFFFVKLIIACVRILFIVPGD
jgi:hypothetical protein